MSHFVDDDVFEEVLGLLPCHGVDADVGVDLCTKFRFPLADERRPASVVIAESEIKTNHSRRIGFQ
jgi:hypothetical protein